MASDDEGGELFSAKTMLPALQHKRRSTMECIFPPLLDSPAAEGAPTITVGGDNTLQRPERLSRGISRNVTPLLPMSPSSGVLEWGEEEVSRWLQDSGMAPEEMQLFAAHDINSGSILLQLTEEHLKEMGVKKIGRRILLTTKLNELRKEAGQLPSLGQM